MPLNLFKFADFFGIAVFTFLITDSIFYLSKKKKDWRAWIRLIIGILGFLTDLGLVTFGEITAVRWRVG